jgi:putative FmdB family regulatory protein
MPLYEYRCSKCGEKFEVIQKFADTPLTVHEACGGTVERLISLSGFSLKGSGWYATDYAKGGSSQKKESDAKSDSTSTESKPSETKSETKTETKTETKSETKTESKPATTTKND